MLYIAALSVFLIVIDCTVRGEHPNGYVPIDAFPEKECFAVPHLTHAIISLIMIFLSFMIAMPFTMASNELNPLAHGLLAQPEAVTEAKCFIIKVRLH